MSSNSLTRISPAAFVQAGLVAGTLDVGAAMAIYQQGPTVILQSIASGLLGHSAFAGGLPVATIGLVLQWAMSMLIAAIFVFAARRMPALLRHWIISGVAYGVAVFAVMNYVVVPFSRAGHGSMPHFSALHLAENLLAMIVFGLIIAWFSQRHAGATGSSHPAG